MGNNSFLKTGLEILIQYLIIFSFSGSRAEEYLYSVVNLKKKLCKIHSLSKMGSLPLVSLQLQEHVYHLK